MRGPSMWSVALVLASVVASVVLDLISKPPGLEALKQWPPSPLWLVFAPLVALAAIHKVRPSLRSHQSGTATSQQDAVALLRARVHDQWSQELGARQLRQPRPLQLRWRPTSRRVQVTSSGAGEGESNALRGELVQHPSDTMPPADALVEAFQGDPRPQMVVLGEPGAGKSTLAILFTVAAIDKADSDDPVPVVLSAAGWDPHERIEDWIVRRLGEDYPELTQRSGGMQQAERLLRDRKLLPILDGLDEVSSALGTALGDLDRSAGTGRPMVITCRSGEFEQAVAQRGALSQAAVVEIQPVEVQDAATFLTQAEVEGSHRWDAVTEAMTRDPEGPLARLLSTPLMISLARRVYHRPSSRPQELTEFSTVEAARHHVLEELLRVAYLRERDRARAQRWLAFLAHHLQKRVRNPNFEWWHLARAVPKWVFATLIAVITLPALLVGLVPDEPPVLGAASAAAFGVMIGLRVGRAAHAPSMPAGRRRVLATVGGMLHDLGIVVATFFAISAILLLVSLAITPDSAIDTASEFADWTDPSSTIDSSVAILAAAVFIVGIVSNVINVNGLPQRSVPRLRRLLPSLAMSVGVGFIVGIVVFVIALFAGSDFYTSIGFGVVFGFLVAIPVGLARWLATPAEQQKAHSPRAVLRADRAALLIAAGASGVTMALIFEAIALAPPADPLLHGVLLSISLGGVIAIIVGAESAWMSYTVARLWLALCGRLPWRLMRFLRAAHVKSGILRQVGPAYQLRHDLLQTHFAQQWPRARGRLWRLVDMSSGHDQRSTGYRQRPWRVLLGIVVSIVLLYGTVTFTYHP
jgi:hypothetical protein